MFGFGRNKQPVTERTEDDRKRIEERRSFLKKSGTVAGAATALAVVPGSAVAKALSEGKTMTHDPAEAPVIPKTVKPTPELKSKLRGVDLTTPRALSDEVARDLMKATDWGRKDPKVTASFIIQDGNELHAVRVPLEVDWEATRSAMSSGQSWAGWKFKHTSWDCDRDEVEAIGVYVRWHDINDYTIAHFVKRPPKISKGNVLTVNYSMIN